MGLIARPVAGKKKSQILCEAFIAGAPKNAVGEVFYGVDKSNAREWNRVQRLGLPYYYIDNSYFDSVRGGVTVDPNAPAQFRVTRNRMQVNAVQHTSDGKRFDALGLEIKPVQSNPEGHWVLIEQSESFMHLCGAPDWFASTKRWVNDSGRKVVLRPWSGDKPKLQSTLAADLEGAWFLVTYSSAAAVTALMAGIPALVETASAVAHLRLSTDNSVDDRREVFSVLADYQFTVNEMKEGLAWAKVGS